MNDARVTGLATSKMFASAVPPSFATRVPQRTTEPTPSCDVVHMGSVNKPNDSSVRKFLGIHVRVFWCLALICALEVRCRLSYSNRQPRRSSFAPLTTRPRSSQVLLWSFCLFASQSSGAAQAYYTRETVRVRARQPRPPR